MREMAGPKGATMRGPKRSLRLKLTLWFLGTYAAIQLILIAAIVLAQRDAIRRSADDQLLDWARSTTESIGRSGLPQLGAGLMQRLPESADVVWVAVRGHAGEIIRSTQPIDPSTVSFSPKRDPATGLVGRQFSTLAEGPARALGGKGHELRLVTIPFREGSGELLWLQLAAPISTLSQFLGLFSDLLRVGMPAGLLAALISAWIIAGRAVSPLRHLAKAARSVDPDKIDERLELKTSDGEVENLTLELNSALERLEAGYRVQEQFIDNVCHELKTPIAVILTESQVLSQDGASLEDYAHYVRSTEEEMRRLGQLVESFLTLTRAGVGRMLLNEVYVFPNDIVMDAVQSSAQIAGQRDVRLIPTLAEPEVGAEDEFREPELLGDPELLRTMLSNLLRNAIRFSDPGETIDVRAACRDKWVEFSVSDRGPGVPEEYRERIFDRFVQVPSESASREGVGLGLTIARTVAELHGGSIDVVNREEGGCTFTVRLPLWVEES